MNEDEFEALCRWGEGLIQDGRAEVRAAGKAILLLAREVERLQVALWHARLDVPAAAENAASLAEEEEGQSEVAPEGTLPEDLRGLLSRVTKRLQPGFFQRG